VRLKNYCYASAGAYFVTICVPDRKCVFGDVNHGVMVLNEQGKTVLCVWEDLPNHIGNIKLDQFVVMPNHVHGIIHITVGAGSEPAPTEFKKYYALPEIIRQFKTFSAKRINQMRRLAGVSVWQRGYYDRVIRNDRELNKIREYIFHNPKQWELDEFYRS
jgi:REP element-mobilizing transposase RayT